MGQFALAGLVMGGVYAIAAVGLVVSYQATGIFNLAFAGMAYFIARFFYYFNVQRHWSIAPSAILAVGIIGPLLGVFLWAVLFRALAGMSTLIQVVVTIGLSVTLPPFASVLFGNNPLTEQVGLAPTPVPVYHVAGVAIDLNQVIVLACTAALVVIGSTVMRFTNVGLAIRALVDSELMTTISGKDPQRLGALVWAVSVFLAGLAGVLMAPIIPLDQTAYAILIAGALAAVIIARLRNAGVAVVAALAIGVIGALLQGALPPASTFTNEVLPAVPFALVVFFLLAYSWGGPLKTHIVAARRSWNRRAEPSVAAKPAPRPAAPRSLQPRLVGDQPVARPRRQPFHLWLLDQMRTYPGFTLILIVLAVVPYLVSSFWVGLMADGVAYGVTFLSYTLITGMAGFVSLAQVSFAGLGAGMTGVFATHLGIPVLLAMVLAGFVVAPMGFIVGLLTLRLGDLQVALVTLTLGLLMDNIVFTLDIFNNNGDGITVARPDWAAGNRGFLYLSLVIFLLVSLILVRYRRSTGGLGLSALRGSEIGARSLGVNVVGLKIFMLSVGAFIAGMGGGLLAAALHTTNPSIFSTLGGLVWIAVLALNGIDGILAALVAGVTFTVIPGLFQTYLPQSVAEIPALGFGLGAINVVKNPEGVIAQNARQFRSLGRRISRGVGRLFPKTIAAMGPVLVQPVGGTLAAVSSGELPGGGADTGSGSTPPGRRSEAAAPGDGAHPGVRFPTDGVPANGEAIDRPEGEPRLLVVEAREVSVRFGGVVALDGVSLAVPEGGSVGLIGPNGAGKTTLFGAISGLLRPDGGSVYLHGSDVTTLSVQARARLGLGRTFQRPEIFPALTVREHLALAYRTRYAPRRLYSDFVLGPTRWQMDLDESALVAELLAMLGLSDLRDRSVQGLPLGATRRVEVGRALAREPDVLLLDEPTSGLDEVETAELGAALRLVRQRWGVATVLVEHDVEFVLTMCDEVTVLDFGRVICAERPEQVREDPKVRAAYLGV
jgi:branched-chain amino acid transport system permease protein